MGSVKTEVNPNDRYSMYAGYSFLHGTETMQYLKRVFDGQRLHWAYLMLAFNPNIFSTTWNDKK